MQEQNINYKNNHLCSASLKAENDSVQFGPTVATSKTLLELRKLIPQKIHNIGTS